MKKNVIVFIKFILLLISINAGTLSAQSVKDDLGQQVKNKIVTQANKSMAKYHVPGVSVAVIRNGKINWIQGIGFADKAAKSKVTEDTIFNIGSISKTVSAWGFMQLVEKKVIDLDAPIETYLSRWQLPASDFDSNEVTLRRLLSHSAGLSLHGYPGFQHHLKLPSLEASLSGNNNGAGKVIIEIKPGTQYRYSGGGYTIAQLMLEEQTKTNFASYMKQNILVPLGMHASYFGWTQSPKAATPYDEHGNPIKPVRFTALAAAGLETSCHDLALFAVASLNNQTPAVLKNKTIELMKKKASPGNTPRSAGLGYQQMKLGPYQMVGHLGSNEGWQAAMLLKLETKDGIIILTNGTQGDKIARQLFQIWARSLPTSTLR